LRRRSKARRAAAMPAPAVRRPRPLRLGVRIGGRPAHCARLLGWSLVRNRRLWHACGQWGPAPAASMPPARRALLAVLRWRGRRVEVGRTVLDGCARRIAFYTRRGHARRFVGRSWHRAFPRTAIGIFRDVITTRPGVAMSTVQAAGCADRGRLPARQIRGLRYHKIAGRGQLFRGASSNCSSRE
jgi:hypothetical protein